MNKYFIFIVALILWLLLLWPVNYQDVIMGILVALLTSFMFAEIFDELSDKILEPRRYFWFLIYIPVFLWECIKANFDVAYRVIHPKLPINPGVVKVKTSLKSAFSKTLLANSITLTPGTLSVDIVGEYLYIHWIDVKDKDVKKATAIIVERFENLIRKIFE